MPKNETITGGIGFLGAGRMAQALAAGFVRGGLVPPAEVIAYNPSPAASEAFEAAVGPGAKRAASASEVVKSARIVFLAVKPYNAAEALAAAADEWQSDKQLLVSVAAGVTLEALAKPLPKGAAIVRVMPNTPCLIGKGACCYALGEHATADQGADVQRLLSAVGFASETPEKLLDAVTGLSGSGPAFVYTIIEALADGGVRAGLPRALAAELAAHTVAGAAGMVATTGEHPAALRDAVASPGGTTIAGLAELERHGVRSALIEAVTTAARRSAELGKS
ncbi:Pyrroline-5-carboxylate reductase [Botrimarina colliarenosi]|uniref:Pyrroline-5-carboxylate reductase n=1 Tax=Botrimarina colliarenosi TaxID=2528001 RepID=A0A5C6AJM7_9BACT|nr:pyrroline-5-carboxylate reductase [Botrimarina colliarenosi]TWT99606.1 Pyrroline-5-carboxylate reductase [Botrimarina colliarenosi]